MVTIDIQELVNAAREGNDTAKHELRLLLANRAAEGCQTARKLFDELQLKTVNDN